MEREGFQPSGGCQVPDVGRRFSVAGGVTMRRTVISICCLGAVAALPLSVMTHAAPAAGSTAIVEAAMNGNRDVVRSLLKDGGDVNTSQADGMTALHWAAQKGD